MRSLFFIFLLCPTLCSGEFGFVDVNMLVDERDRDADGFAEIKVRRETCEDDPTRFFPDTISILSKIDDEQSNVLPRFSLEMGQMKVKLPPNWRYPLARIIDSFTARINISSTKFAIELPAWYFANSTNLIRCDPAFVSIDNSSWTVAFKTPFTNFQQPGAVIIRPMSFDYSLLKDISKFIRPASSNITNYYLGGDSLLTICPGSGSLDDFQLPSAEDLKAKSITFRNYFYEERAKLATFSPTYVIVDRSSVQHSSVKSLMTDGHVFCQNNLKCLPYFIYGPEFSNDLQCKVRCRPMDPALRHREDLCYPDYVHETAFGIKCSHVIVNGNEITDIVSSYLSMVLPQHAGKLNITIRCRVPNDQYYLLSRCEDDPSAFCDPTITISENKKDPPFYEANRISSSPGVKSPMNVIVDKLSLTASGFSVTWGPNNNGDLRYFDIQLVTNDDVNEVWLKESAFGSFLFSLAFKNQTLSHYNENLIARIDLLKNYTRSDKITAYIEHDVNIGFDEFGLRCDAAYKWDPAITSQIVWEKFIGDRYQSKESLSKNDRLDSSARAFVDNTMEIFVEQHFWLKFDQISDGHAGLYRCHNKLASKWQYHLIRVVQPSHCSLFIDNLPVQTFPTVNSNFGGLGFNLVAEDSCIQNRTSSVKFAITCDIGTRAFAICGSDKTVCNPYFGVFEDDAVLWQTPFSNKLLLMSFSGPTFGFSYNVQLKSRKRYTMVAAFEHDSRSCFDEKYLQENLPSFVVQGSSCAVKFREQKSKDRCYVVIGEHAAFMHTKIVRLQVTESLPINVTFVCELVRQLRFCDDGSICDPEISVVAGNSETELTVVQDGANRYASEWFWQFITVSKEASKTEPNKVRIKLSFFQNSTLYKDAISLDENILKMLSSNYSVRFNNSLVDSSGADSPDFFKEISRVSITIVRSKPHSLETDCRRTAEGYEYVGNTSQIMCGGQCEEWSQVKDEALAKRLGFADQDVDCSAVAPGFSSCRNPRDQISSQSVPFCSVSMPGGKNAMPSYCYIPMCDDTEERAVLARYSKYNGICPCVRGNLGYAHISLSECADLCDSTSKCGGFNYNLNGICSLFTCSCGKLVILCAPTIPTIYYRKEEIRQDFIDPTTQAEKGSESYTVHLFDEGAIGVQIKCKMIPFFVIQKYIDVQANWQIFDSNVGSFKDVDPQRVGSGPSQMRGSFLSLSTDLLKTEAAGLYRCLFNGTQEYHQVEVYPSLKKCDAYLNELQVGSVTNSYGVTLIFASQMYPISFDFVCEDYSRRNEQWDQLGNLVNPIVRLSVNWQEVSSNEVNVSVTSKRFHARAIIPKSSVSGDRMNVTLRINYLPRPVRNTVTPMTATNYLPFNVKIPTAPLSPENDSMAIYASYAVSVMNGRQKFYVKPWSADNGSIEILLVPGQESDLTVNLNLTHPGAAFCNGIVDKCFPFQITVSKLLKDDEFQKVFEVDHRKEDGAQNTAGAFQFTFIRPSTLGMIDVKLIERGSISAEGIEKTRKLLGGIYFVDIRITNGGIFKEQIIRLKLVFRVAPTYFNTERDCYRDGTAYGGVSSASGCIKAKCLNWAAVKASGEMPSNLAKIWPDANDNQCRSINLDRQPECPRRYLVNNATKIALETCDIPECVDYSDTSNYEHFRGRCTQCSNQVKPWVVPTPVLEILKLTDCQAKCDSSEDCSGFEFEVKESKCYIHNSPCSCPHSDVCDPNMNNYYFRKLPGVLPSKHIFQTDSFQSVIRTYYLLDLDKTIRLYSRAQKKLSFFAADTNAGQSVGDHSDGKQYGSVSLGRGTRRGVYVLESAGLPTEYHFIKSDAAMTCTLMVGETRGRLHFYSAFFPLSGYDDLLGTRNRILTVSCDLERSWAYCLGSNSLLCNPKVSVYYASNFSMIYASWREVPMGDFYKQFLTVVTPNSTFVELHFDMRSVPALHLLDLVISLRTFPTKPWQWPVGPFTLDDNDVDNGMSLPFHLTLSSVPVTSSISLVLAAFILSLC